MIPKFALKHVARWGVLRNRETSRPDPQAGESGSERSSETAMARVHSDERVGRMEFQLQLRQRGIMDKSVMRALDEVPREYFVPPDYSAVAYAEKALPNRISVAPAKCGSSTGMATCRRYPNLVAPRFSAASCQSGLVPVTRPQCSRASPVRL